MRILDLTVKSLPLVYENVEFWDHLSTSQCNVLSSQKRHLLCDRLASAGRRLMVSYWMTSKQRWQ